MLHEISTQVGEVGISFLRIDLRRMIRVQFIVLDSGYLTALQN